MIGSGFLFFVDRLRYQLVKAFTLPAPEGQFELIMTYRAEIDGIRAIAVLSVILYHAGFSVAGGGYAGVDVFFVISGYLIGGQILGDLEAGSFSFREFIGGAHGASFPPCTWLFLSRPWSALS